MAIIWDEPAAVAEPPALSGSSMPPEPDPSTITAPRPSGIVWDPLPGSAPITSTPALPSLSNLVTMVPSGPSPSLASTVTTPMPSMGLAPTPAPPADTGEGFFSGLVSGGQAAVREGARTLSGQAFTLDENAPVEPQSRGWFNELGYGIGHSFPTLIAGLGGGAAGAAIGAPAGGIGAVPGAVIGSGLGVGLMSAAQDLAPTYAAARARGLEHDAAVTYAWEHGLATGAISGITAYIPGPAKTVLGHFLWQTIVGQPVSGAATRIGVPAVMGEPLPSPEDLVRGAGQDIVAGAAIGGGHAIGSRVAANAAQATRNALNPPPAAGSPVETAGRAAFAATGEETPTQQIYTPPPVTPPAPAPDAPISNVVPTSTPDISVTIPTAPAIAPEQQRTRLEIDPNFVPPTAEPVASAPAPDQAPLAAPVSAEPGAPVTAGARAPEAAGPAPDPLVTPLQETGVEPAAAQPPSAQEPIPESHPPSASPPSASPRPAGPAPIVTGAASDQPEPAAGRPLELEQPVARGEAEPPDAGAARPRAEPPMGETGLPPVEQAAPAGPGEAAPAARPGEEAAAAPTRVTAAEDAIRARPSEDLSDTQVRAALEPLHGRDLDTMTPEEHRALYDEERADLLRPETSETPVSEVSGRAPEITPDLIPERAPAPAQTPQTRQLERLTATRDRLEAKPNKTLAERLQLNRTNTQIEKLQRAQEEAAAAKVRSEPPIQTAPGAEPATPLERLTAARDALAAKPDKSVADRLQLNRLNTQIEKAQRAAEERGIQLRQAAEGPQPTSLPRGSTRIERLTAARDALEAKPDKTIRERLELNRLNTQLEKAQRAAEEAANRRGGVKEPYTGPPQVGRPLDFKDYQFNDGTSVYRAVFADRGVDPDTAVNRPIKWQNTVLTQNMKGKFEFRDVRVTGAGKRMDPKAPPDPREGRPTPVQEKEARDAMLDMTRAIQDFMATLGLPHSSASYHGRLELVIDPQDPRRTPYLGLYSSSSNGSQIRVQAGGNSFGHEWTHAMDHVLAERFTGNPQQMNNLLTMYARAPNHPALDMKDPVQAAMAKIINLMFYDKAALAARQLTLETAAAKTDSAGNPTKGALAAQRQLDELRAGGSQLRIRPSRFRTESAGLGDPAYWASVQEMLARTHEAYIADKMRNAGVDPRGVVMPDEAYINEVDQQLKSAYPKDERTALFEAFDELHQALRNEQVLSQGKPAGEFANYGVSDPHYWPVTAPGAKQTMLGRLISQEIARDKRFFENLAREGLRDRNRADPGYLSAGVRAADAFRAVTFSSHGMMDTIIDRSPDQAKRALTFIKDLLTPAPGEGRLTHEAFEEAIRRRDRGWMNRYANIMDGAGLGAQDIGPGDVRADMLRHHMTTGETFYRDPDTGTRVKIPANIIKAGGDLRFLMDDMWQASHRAGMDVGYASQYYPRLYDLQKFFADPDGFRQRAAELHQLMFDREVGQPGDNPQSLLERWTTLDKIDKASAPTAVAQEMRRLNRTLRKVRELEENPARTPAQDAELARLQSEAETIAAGVHNPLRDHVADLAAVAWANRMGAGNHADFDTTGPSSRYLRARTLPPEADQIMKDFMHTDPFDAIPNYIHAVSRRIAFTERFGQHGEELKKILNQVRQVPGMRGEDVNRFEGLVNNVTGRQNDRSPQMRDLQRLSNTIHAVGALALMPRAVWSSLAEPMSAALSTGDARVGFKTFANVFGQLMRTAGAEDRTALADFLNVTTNAQTDSIMHSRMSADYSDSPRLNRLMSSYYRVTGLTQLTNAQRIGAMAANNWFLAKLAEKYQEGSPRARDDAARWFRELGLRDGIHNDFATWMRDLDGGLPSLQQLMHDPMQGAYGLAIRRLTDRVIQEPYKVDRAALAGVPVLGLAFQLMSFNYSFQRNVLNPAWARVEHSFGRAKSEAAAAGAGRIGSTAAGLAYGGGALVHAAAMASTMIGAGLMTTALRQWLYASDQWDQHEKDGTLGDYLLNLTFQRSGLNGTLDPIIQVFTHLRYQADLTSLMEGASMNWFAKNAMDVIRPFTDTNDSPNTNTQYFNQAKGAFNLIGVPAAALGLTMLGAAGGPIAKALAGGALQYGTAPGTAAGFAESVAGPKGAKRAPDTGGLAGLADIKGLQELEGLSELGKESGGAAGGGGAGGLIPWGLVDDVVVPAWRYLGPIAARLPTPIKIGGFGAGGVAAGADYLEKTAPFRGQPAPEPKEPRAAAQ